MLNVADRQDAAQAEAETRLWRWPSPARRRRKDYGDLLTMVEDQEFWAGWLEKLKPLLDETFGIIFRAGAEAGFTIEPATKDLLPLDPDAINRSFDRIVTTYTDEWWRQFQTTTQDRMRGAIRRAQTDGTGVEGVIADIEPLFGSQRAMTIAATETTRLFGLGAQAAYSAAGLDEWEWQTVEDGFVCPVCSELNKTQHPIAVPFRPAHPRCRCFPRPVVAELSGTPEPARRRRRPAAGETVVEEQEPAPAPEDSYPAGGFKTRAEVERWLHNKYPNIGFNMKGVNMDSANRLAREIDRQGQKWPEVMARLTYVGSSQTVGLGARERYLSKIMQRKRNTIAFATTDGLSIMFNAGKFASKTAFDDMMYRGVKTGHFGQMEDPFRDGEAYIYAHEFGHQLDNLLGVAGPNTATGYIRISGFGHIGSTVKLTREHFAKAGREVSLYGRQNLQEMWAEGYATSQWGTATAKQNAWIQAQAKLLEELHPSKWKKAPARADGSVPLAYVGDIEDDALRRKANEDLYALAKRLGLPESAI